MKVVKPSDSYLSFGKCIFLAGSIDNGTAEQWQKEAERLIYVFSGDGDITVYNPRRDDWDPNLKQDISDIKFREQVEWEVRNLNISEYIIYYFSPGSVSPITFFEFGLFCSDTRKSKVVICPDGFWRKGNIDIYCQRYSIPQFPNLESAIQHIFNQINLK